MTILKRALVSAAAAGLLVSQTASAAAVSNSRAGSDVAQGEELGFAGASAPMLALFAVFLVVGVVLLVEDGDDDDRPVSP